MDVDELKKEVKRLSMRATNAKMELHDLSEELPIDWRKIPEVAATTHQVFADLDAARKRLKQAEKAAA